MDDVTVLIPWRHGCSHRFEALQHVIGRYVVGLGADTQILVAELAPAEKWCKPKAIRDALPNARDYVVVADADSWCEAVSEAIDAVRDGAPWSMPHEKVHRLTPQSTAAVLTGSEAPNMLLTTVRPAYRGTGAGGVLVAEKATLLDVPPDRRFVGWGSEDGAWRDALRTLVGMEWRDTTAPLYHFWHPPQNKKRTTSPENAALARRYIAARDDQEAMRELVAGG